MILLPVRIPQVMLPLMKEGALDAVRFRKNCCRVNFIAGELTPLLHSGKKAFSGEVALAIRSLRKDPGRTTGRGGHDGWQSKLLADGRPWVASIGKGVFVVGHGASSSHV